MSDKSLAQQLSEGFQELPGVGPRQAQRFVYALLEKEESFLKNFAALITALPGQIKRCEQCFWAFEGRTRLCQFCGDPQRDAHKLLIVERDTDVTNIERATGYSGKYFVLGGSVSPTRTDPQKELRLKELYHAVSTRPIGELILALSATSEGETTGIYIERIMDKLQKKQQFRITRLGRGLSSGAELEYSDGDTLKHAFANRA
ncbi:MAG: recombination protein RecR [Parcubacteria group bacterium]|nr:recombination protein RecR [Parcubacteria group bacterium]